MALEEQKLKDSVKEYLSTYLRHRRLEIQLKELTNRIAECEADLATRHNDIEALCLWCPRQVFTKEYVYVDLIGSVSVVSLRASKKGTKTKPKTDVQITIRAPDRLYDKLEENPITYAKDLGEEQADADE